MITLSPMTLRDIPLFNTVRNASCEWLHDPTRFTLPESVAWFLRGPCQFLILLLDGVPIGYCRVTDGDDAQEKFVGMDIHPDYRGCGLARLGYAELFARLREQGVRRFRLRVLKKNLRARHLYDALGFRITVDLRSPRGDRAQDEVEMRREVD